MSVLRQKVLKLLDGIDREEIDAPAGGWWDTSKGAEFGYQKLTALLHLLDSQDEIIKSLADRVAAQSELLSKRAEVADAAPFRGRWIRDEQHESMMKMHCENGHAIQIHFPWCREEIIERWLVNALHLWPHPNAPVDPNEYDYPAYRNQEYAKLMEAKDGPKT